jgi:hypothetical protein
MEEIRATTDEESSSYSISEFMNLPKLRFLELKSICSEELIRDSLQQFWITSCEKLIVLPLRTQRPDKASANLLAQLLHLEAQHDSVEQVLCLHTQR